MHDNAVIALISAVSGIIVTYITSVLSKKVQTKREPKDRMQQLFDGYDQLIRAKDIEDNRKQKYIESIEKELKLTKIHVTRLEDALEHTNRELTISRGETIDLRERLNEMRIEYKKLK